MREWVSSLTVARVPEIALGLAAGYALVSLADAVAGIPVSVLAQHAGRSPFGGGDPGVVDLFTSPYYLNFSVGGSAVAYGPALAAALSLGLIALVAVYVVRRRDRELGECPFCASRIPYESTHCAYCGSGVAPSETIA